MFDALNERLSGIFSRLRRQGRLSEADIDAAMREVRIALLEADVALPVVKSFVASLKQQALGAEVIQSVSPANMVIKLVQDHLTTLLGSEHQGLKVNTAPPAVILMVGLQGSGKTTSTGKLGYMLQQEQNKRVLVASLDVYRPAAQEQLALVAQQAGLASLPIVAGASPLAISGRALETARLEGYDALLLDTAGRLHIDEALMEELQQVKAQACPVEVLLVADALTGQDAVQIGRSFHERVGITGTILTRADGDGRGGAALSLRHETGQPVKFLGVGEKITEFEPFHPERIAARILDKGDIVSLVEQASRSVDEEQAEKLQARLEQGRFDLNDMLTQLQQMKKMGGIGSMLQMLPGMGNFKGKMGEMGVDETMFKRQEAIILSMTLKERRFPKLLNASRRKRIAAGSGATVQQVNQMMKQYQQMEKMMKKVKKMGGSKALMDQGNMQQLLQQMRK